MLAAEEYFPVMKFLAKVLGPDNEIVLSDLDNILHVENPHSPTSRRGVPLGEREKNFINTPEYHKMPYVVNYRALASSGDRLRSSTMFIRDEEGTLVGTLTLNTRVEDLLVVRALVDTLINGSEPNLNVAESRKAPPIYETLSISIEDLIANIVNDRLAHCGVPADRLTTAERKDIVRELDQKGAFMVKGSVPIVAQRLSSSEATVYRYLHQLNGG